jgi:hypothetical protein
MTTTALQTIIWVVAGCFLALLLLRRGKRKSTRS